MLNEEKPTTYSRTEKVLLRRHREGSLVYKSSCKLSQQQPFRIQVQYDIPFLYTSNAKMKTPFILYWNKSCSLHWVTWARYIGVLLLVATAQFRKKSKDQQSPSRTPQLPFILQLLPATDHCRSCFNSGWSTPHWWAHLAPHVPFQVLLCFHTFSLSFKTTWNTDEPHLSCMDQSRCLIRNRLSASTQFLLISLKYSRTSIFEFSFHTGKTCKIFCKNCSWKDNLKPLS